MASDQGLVIAGSDGQRFDGKRTVVKTDAAGMVQWSLFIPTPNPGLGFDYIYLYSIVADGADHYIVAGQQADTYYKPPNIYKAYLGWIGPLSGAHLGSMYSLLR